MSDAPSSSRHVLQQIQQHLLDLSQRNPLLNFRPRARSLQLVQSEAATVFEQLVTQEQRLPLFGNDKLGEGLHVDLASNKLNYRALHLRREARSIIEETGTNSLYLALGVLHWQPENSNQFVQAPLLLLPVTLEQVRQKGQEQYFLSYSGEDIEVNRSLQEKLANRFQTKLPPFTEECTFNEWLALVRDEVNFQPEWKVTADMWLDFFSFTRLLMYRDLNDKQWPETQFDRVQHLFNAQASRAEALPLAANADLPLVLEADSSQRAVVQQALLSQRSLVVEGPPGTGKSQTIANLIAAALAMDKTVLFVAEKQAALEVVQQRLHNLGLGEFCLALHSHQSSKGQFHQALRQRLAQNPSPLPLPLASPSHQKKNCWIAPAF